MRSFRVWRPLFGLLLAVMLIGWPIQATPAGATPSTPVVVLVQEVPGQGVAAKASVTSVQGKVLYDLPIINGFAAEIPSDQVRYVERDPSIREVTQDAPVKVQSLLTETLGGSDNLNQQVFGGVKENLSELLKPKTTEAVVEGEISGNVDKVVDSAEGAVTGNGVESTDAANESVHKSVIGADVAAAAGATGAGTTVALIDTGVTDLPDISDSLVDVRTPAGTTKRCVDLSGEDSCQDNYGHGTFLAGLIAGNGSQSGGKYTGVAPEAKILSIKISGRDGSASVGKILFAIQWVTAHKDEYGVKVMNLSLGTDSRQSYRYDPLNFAVQQAWRSGIAVVVSAGNTGPGARTITKPADDPFVITTGAVDDLRTTDRSDDILPDFSAKGPTKTDGISKPDLVAPGAHLVSLRAPGSAVEEKFPGGGVDSVYRRGSGTSQSAAVVSGAAALLLSAKPNMTPNQVKFALKNSTNPAASADPNSVGTGVLDIGKAVTNTPRGEANQGLLRSWGGGSLKETQGSVRLAVKDRGHVLGVLGSTLPVRGEDRYDPSGGSWYGTSWYGGSWYGTSWYGGSWYGGSWYGGSWYGGSWYGGSWYGGSWYGGSWYGGSWYGGSWYGAWD